MYRVPTLVLHGDERDRSGLLGRPARRWSELTFRSLCSGGSLFVLLLIAAIALFLVVRAAPALHRAGWHFFTERQWFPDDPKARFGIAALAFGTVLSSLLALLMAVPVALGTALFLTELAPGRVGRAIGSLVDLLAAVPSVVYGLWGVFVLVPTLIPVERWFNDNVGFVPLFDNRFGTYGRSVFAASVVLAVMVLPIVAAISREIFGQVPQANREAAVALGATRWETIRLAVLPYGRSGIVGAVMLGLGRALGETIALALTLGSVYAVNFDLLGPGGNTIAANIANRFGEAGDAGRGALIASGLVLFAITLVVNIVARSVVYRTALAAEGGP